MAENKELTPEELLKASQEENKKLAAELKATSEALELRAKDLEASGVKLNASEDQINSLNEVIRELNESLASKDEEIASKSKRPVIKSGKKSYALRFKKFTHRHNGKAVEVTEEVLKANPAMVAELVKMKSGALIEIGGK